MQGRAALLIGPALLLGGCQPGGELDISVISPDDIRISPDDEDNCISQLAVYSTRGGNADEPVWDIEDRHPERQICIPTIRIGQTPPGWRVKVPMQRLEQGSYIVQVEAGFARLSGRFVYR